MGSEIESSFFESKVLILPLGESLENRFWTMDLQQDFDGFWNQKKYIYIYSFLLRFDVVIWTCPLSGPNSEILPPNTEYSLSNTVIKTTPGVYLYYNWGEDQYNIPQSQPIGKGQSKKNQRKCSPAA